MKTKRTRRNLLLVVLILTVATAVTYFGNRASLANDRKSSTESATTTPQTPCQLLPTDVKVQAGYGEGGGTAPREQGEFDTFSWQSFVALNCAANPNAPPPKDP